MPAIDMWPIFLHLSAARGVPTDLYMIVIMCWPRLIGIMPEVSISLAKPFRYWSSPLLQRPTAEVFVAPQHSYFRWSYLKQRRVRPVCYGRPIVQNVDEAILHVVRSCRSVDRAILSKTTFMVPCFLLNLGLCAAFSCRSSLSFCRKREASTMCGVATPPFRLAAHRLILPWLFSLCCSRRKPFKRN